MVRHGRQIEGHHALRTAREVVGRQPQFIRDQPDLLQVEQLGSVEPLVDGALVELEDLHEDLDEVLPLFPVSFLQCLQTEPLDLPRHRPCIYLCE